MKLSSSEPCAWHHHRRLSQALRLLLQDPCVRTQPRPSQAQKHQDLQGELLSLATPFQPPSNHHPATIHPPSNHYSTTIQPLSNHHQTLYDHLPTTIQSPSSNPHYTFSSQPPQTTSSPTEQLVSREGHGIRLLFCAEGQRHVGGVDGRIGTNLLLLLPSRRQGGFVTCCDVSSCNMTCLL